MNLESFWEKLASAEKKVLLLDYDGTLAPFRIERDRAFPYPGVRDILEKILADGRSRTVIVSGRSLEDLLPLLGLEEHPEAWGCHGWERLFPDGRRRLEALPGEARAALDEAGRWALEAGFEKRCEIKPVSVALHWRGEEKGRMEEMAAEAEDAWAPLAARGSLEMHPFDGGLELRCPGRDKGDAVRQVLEETGEGAAVAYLGDDLTDEDAFLALGGRGLSILMREEERPSAADIRLRPPEDLLEFLNTWRKVAAGGKDKENAGR